MIMATANEHTFLLVMAFMEKYLQVFKDNGAIEQNILGHYNVRFTRQRYMNAQDNQIQRGMDKLAAYMTAL